MNERCLIWLHWQFQKTIFIFQEVIYTPVLDKNILSQKLKGFWGITGNSKEIESSVLIIGWANIKHFYNVSVNIVFTNTKSQQGARPGPLHWCMVGRSEATGREWKRYFTLKVVNQWSKLSQESWSFSRSNWTKRWATWFHLRAAPALTRRMDKKPPEVPSRLNYPMDLQC